MNRRLFGASALSTAVALAIAMQTLPARADMNTPGVNMEAVKKGMDMAKQNRLEQCYGINAVAKNDCAEGAHSCAGQATQARDPKSFVYLPAGDCSKIAGGKLTKG